MSHKTTVQTEIRDLEALKRAAEKMDEVDKIQIAEHGQELDAKLYQGVAKGVAVIKFKSWTYPVVVKADGTAEFDNYNGSWGKTEHLDKLTQLYAAEVTVQKVKQQGLRIISQTTKADGTIQIRASK